MEAKKSSFKITCTLKNELTINCKLKFIPASIWLKRAYLGTNYISVFLRFLLSALYTKVSSFQLIHRLHTVVPPHYTTLCLIVKFIILTRLAKWKTENTSGFLSKFWKVNKISVRLTICEASSNQKSNPRERQYVNILLALAYHDKATFETFRQLEPSTTELFLLVKCGCFVFRLKLQKDLCTSYQKTIHQFTAPPKWEIDDEVETRLSLQPCWFYTLSTKPKSFKIPVSSRMNCKLKQSLFWYY